MRHGGRGRLCAALLLVVIRPLSAEVSARSCEDLLLDTADAWGPSTVCASATIQHSRCAPPFTLRTAQAWCRAGGMRLCTAGELALGVADAVGCGLEVVRVWTSSEAACPLETVVSRAADTGQARTHLPRCENVTAQLHPVCCADTQDVVSALFTEKDIASRKVVSGGASMGVGAEAEKEEVAVRQASLFSGCLGHDFCNVGKNAENLCVPTADGYRCRCQGGGWQADLFSRACIAPEVTMAAMGVCATCLEGGSEQCGAGIANGGDERNVCVDNFGCGYTCLCGAPFWRTAQDGQGCLPAVSACLADPCHSEETDGGDAANVCTAGEGGTYTCTCEGLGWRNAALPGKGCEVASPCTRDPCSSRADTNNTCTVFADDVGYICRCGGGLSCEQPPSNGCEDDPCMTVPNPFNRCEQLNQAHWCLCQPPYRPGPDAQLCLPPSASESSLSSLLSLPSSPPSQSSPSLPSLLLELPESSSESSLESSSTSPTAAPSISSTSASPPSSSASSSPPTVEQGTGRQNTQPVSSPGACAGDPCKTGEANNSCAPRLVGGGHTCYCDAEQGWRAPAGAQTCTNQELSTRPCADLTAPFAPLSDSVCASGQVLLSANSSWACAGPAAFGIATDSCRAIGARLCSATELARGLTRDDPCALDARRVWTGTICGNGSAITQAGNRDYLITRPALCSAGAEEHPFLCCADVYESSAPRIPLTSPPSKQPTATPTAPLPKELCVATGGVCPAACSLFNEHCICNTCPGLGIIVSVDRPPPQEGSRLLCNGVPVPNCTAIPSLPTAPTMPVAPPSPPLSLPPSPAAPQLAGDLCALGDPCRAREDAGNTCRPFTAAPCVCGARGYSAGPGSRTCQVCSDPCARDPCARRQGPANQCVWDMLPQSSAAFWRQADDSGCPMHRCECGVGFEAVDTLEGSTCRPLTPANSAGCVPACSRAHGDPCVTSEGNTCRVRTSPSFPYTPYSPYSSGMAMAPMMSAPLMSPQYMYRTSGLYGAPNRRQASTVDGVRGSMSGGGSSAGVKMAGPYASAASAPIACEPYQCECSRGWAPTSRALGCTEVCVDPCSTDADPCAVGASGGRNTCGSLPNPSGAGCDTHTCQCSGQEWVVAPDGLTCRHCDRDCSVGDPCRVLESGGANRCQAAGRAQSQRCDFTCACASGYAASDGGRACSARVPTTMDGAACPNPCLVNDPCLLRQSGQNQCLWPVQQLLGLPGCGRHQCVCASPLIVGSDGQACVPPSSSRPMMPSGDLQGQLSGDACVGDPCSMRAQPNNFCEPIASMVRPYMCSCDESSGWLASFGSGACLPPGGRPRPSSGVHDYCAGHDSCHAKNAGNVCVSSASRQAFVCRCEAPLFIRTQDRMGCYTLQ